MALNRPPPYVDGYRPRAMSMPPRTKYDIVIRYRPAEPWFNRLRRYLELDLWIPTLDDPEAVAGARKLIPELTFQHWIPQGLAPKSWQHYFEEWKSFNNSHPVSISTIEGILDNPEQSRDSFPPEAVCSLL